MFWASSTRASSDISATRSLVRAETWSIRESLASIARTSIGLRGPTLNRRVLGRTEGRFPRCDELVFSLPVSPGVPLRLNLTRTAALGLAAAIVLAAPASAKAAKTQYYVSLGDSYAVGYQPGQGSTREGFADQTVKKARK